MQGRASERRRTIGRARLAAFSWRRSTTLNPARSNIAERALVGVRRGIALASRDLDRVRLEHRRAVVARVVDRPRRAARRRHPGHATSARRRSTRSTRPACRRPGASTLEKRGARSRHADRCSPSPRPSPRRTPRVLVRDPRSPRGVSKELARLSAGVDVRPVAAADAEVRAPAPLRVAALLEQGREVGDALRGQRLDIERHGLDASRPS